MADIVERLRVLRTKSYGPIGLVKCINEALDEIERLRGQVDRMSEALEDAREYISGEVEDGFRPAIRLMEKITAALTSTEGHDGK